MLQQPLRVEIFEIFGKGGGNLIWGDLAFYWGDFRNHSFENISHGTPKFIIWEKI